MGSFSLGLALVLVSLGLVAVYAGQWLEKFPENQMILQKLSIVSAFFVVLIGMGLTFISAHSFA